MKEELHGIPAGMTVIALNGEVLGRVREVHEHYLLIDQPHAHRDLDLPIDAISDSRDGNLHVSVNREALTEVDHEETVHRQDDGEGPYSG